jgi:hypothetical protein
VPSVALETGVEEAVRGPPARRPWGRSSSRGSCTPHPYR